MDIYFISEIKLEHFADLVKSTGEKDMIAFLNEAGGSPLTDASWDEDSYNTSRHFYNPLLRTTAFFLGHEISGRCNDPRNSSNEILCFRFQSSSTSPGHRRDILEMFKSLSMNGNLKVQATESYLTFLNSKQLLEKEFNSSEKMVFRIKELPRMFPNLTLDWVKLINENLLSHSHITDDDEIGIEKLKLFEKLSELFTSLEKR